MNSNLPALKLVAFPYPHCFREPFYSWVAADLVLRALAQLTEMCLTWAQGKSEGWETESLKGKGDPLNKVTG